MSGIAAIVNFDGKPVSSELLTKMTDQVAYRGPHGVSFLIKDDVGFGHLALHSTPESEFEKQPLVHFETGIILVADARVDNRQELLRKLSLSRTTDRPVTDADIIMAAYLRWGKETAKYIIGDFAFLVWDPREKGVYAARDPMGIRNFHYAITGNTLLLASEAQQILQYPTISNELNESAVIEWAIGLVGSKLCMYEDANVLQAGRSLWANSQGSHVTRYWDIDPSKRIRYRRNSDYAEHFLEVLSNAVEVRLRTRSNAVGAELSGGMDSTTIVALAKKTLDERDMRLETISYQYPQTPSCDETAYIESIATHLSLKPYYIDAEKNGALEYPRGFKQTLESPWVCDYPFMHKPLDYLREQGCEVLLTGNGGDEVAQGGVPGLRHRLLHGDIRVLSELVRHSKQNGVPLGNALYHEFLEPHLPGPLDRTLRRLLDKRIREKQDCPAWITSSAIARLSLFEQYYTPSKLQQFSNTVSQDRYENLIEGPTPAAYGAYEWMAAQYQMEARHPFLDQNVIEFCFAVPDQLWYRDLYPKWLLRHATEGLLPDSVRWRPDKSVSTDVFCKAIGNNRDYIEKVLKYNVGKVPELYNTDTLKNEFDLHYQQGSNTMRGDIDSAMNLQCWLYTNRQFLEG